jgi:hypothetical protein
MADSCSGQTKQGTRLLVGIGLQDWLDGIVPSSSEQCIQQDLSGDYFSVTAGKPKGLLLKCEGSLTEQNGRQ